MSHSKNTNCSDGVLVKLQQLICCIYLSISDQLPDQISWIEVDRGASTGKDFCRIEHVDSVKPKVELTVGYGALWNNRQVERIVIRILNLILPLLPRYDQQAM